MNGKASLAWELYLRMETSDDSYHLVQIIANDCYRMGAFYYAAKVRLLDSDLVGKRNLVEWYVSSSYK